MGKAIGIDLGTTNSVGAFKLAEVEVVTANDNTPPDRKLTRSLVAYDQDKLLVGNQAYNQLRADPENVIVSIKRLIGRGFSDQAVKKQKSEVGYKISEPSYGTDNSIAVWLGGKEYSPEDISAEILKKVVSNAQAYRQGIGKIDEVIDQAVITIPAYFNDQQRHATRTAALKAGLTPLELLPEPTAAAISYGFSPDSEDVKTILVYDFGGGTFDASLITAAGTSFIEQGKAGDLWLGGDDIDSQMMSFVKTQVAQEERITDIDGLIAKMPHYQRLRFNADLKMAVERAKVELSSAQVARISPATQLLDELGIAIPIEVEITRQQFEAMIGDLVDRSVQICRLALQDAEYHLEMVDIVLLVGGSSQIPLVQRKVKEAFGNNKVVLHPRPMYAVAEGAAIVAAGQTDKVTTVSRDYYIKLLDDRYKVINRNDILPVITSHTFKTVADGQRLIHFQFFSPDQVREELDGVDKKESIGDMWLGLNEVYPKGTEILVNLELDEKNSALKMTATLKNDPAERVSCTFSRGRSDEKIYRELEVAIAELNNQDLTQLGVEEALKLAVPVVKLANSIIDPKTEEERIDKREDAQVSLQKFQVSMSKEALDAESLMNECDRIVQICGFLIPPPQKERLQKLSQDLQGSINAHDLSRMESYSEDARRELDHLPNEVQVIQASLLAIRQARQVAPTKASAMSDKLYRLLEAMESGNPQESDRLWQELQPDVKLWLNQELPSNMIATGISR
ncbi:Heat shock protein Hsp70 [Trichormus variabilis ATCC 29413]|uniref:Heat shock protein Hsp70 n=2 Tax=Anabaena variabilis TaxID=264691 RepID=Q3MDJ6_TRIV2|nr:MULTISPECIES: Hsp70 family protein [Nostocaceae]ABA20940.1 Heat shock protein Hsp70 [Trichormus variabilis ATCC 29413]MBC1214206.1 Hsp70 family protein [Trichormus variabilis ARAD]MBC1256688.1 Hsp70 family protein [Trichormus variabilis V5]MBC1265615.1 Hsp70 family protein [Trichormus variabilis FSR]MBC1301714.1 Hsp70 family protein [Trichormus variabilis N2B]